MFKGKAELHYDFFYFRQIEKNMNFKCASLESSGLNPFLLRNQGHTSISFCQVQGKHHTTEKRVL